MQPEHENSEWEPPYQWPQPSVDQNPFGNSIQGECHCGKVQFHVNNSAPAASKFCHCKTCQHIHGAPFQWAAIIHKTDMAISRGLECLQFYNSGSKTSGHSLPCKVSCSYCGTLIMDEGRKMLMLFPTLLQFDSDVHKRNFEASCHIFYPDRVMDIPDGKPKWSGLDNKSELLNTTETFQ